MIRTILQGTALVVAFSFACLWSASAQDEPAATEPKQVAVRPGLTVSDQVLGAVYVTETAVNEAGQWAGVEMYVLGDEGAIRLTPCDDVRVACAPIHIRAEGVNQGDGFPIVAGE